MHNLGLLYFEGAGGQKDLALATQWFRRAADLGLADSQYNLGLVYENGYGVTKNAAEAYKWYVIAARGGDDGARASAERLQRSLSPEAQATAERSALAFRAAGEMQAAGAVAAPSVSADVAAAQRALSQLGYYRGPTDGRVSPALQAAAAAWQRQQGLPADGVIDGELVAGLARAG
jgi:localization factor PodJL